MKKLQWGQDGTNHAITAFQLTNDHGMEVTVLNYGATLARILVPNRENQPTDVILGFQDVLGYEQGTSFQGAIVGRIANRIGKARFQLNGKEYQLEKNNGQNNLHSGLDYFHTRTWDVVEESNQRITFSIESPDGDQGYPGNMCIKVSYSLSEENELQISYEGTCDQDTIINMTNHSYFNLDGYSGGNVLKQVLWLDADAFTNTDEGSIPTGEIIDVNNTPMDFRIAKPIGQDINQDYEPLRIGSGYDHNWVLNTGGEYQLFGSLYSEHSGIKMEAYTDLPGVQIYTGNFLGDSEIDRNGVPLSGRAGVCFETQLFPDAINHDNFQSPILKAGETYRTTTGFKFLV